MGCVALPSALYATIQVRIMHDNPRQITPDSGKFEQPKVGLDRSYCSSSQWSVVWPWGEGRDERTGWEGSVSGQTMQT